MGSPHHARIKKIVLSRLWTKSKSLKIAYIVPDFVALDPEVNAVMKKTINLLEGLGHKIENQTINLPFEEMMNTIANIISSSMANKIDEVEREMNITVDNSLLENVSLQMQKNGRDILAKIIFKQLKRTIRLDTNSKMFADYDVLLSPVLAKPPVKIER